MDKKENSNSSVSRKRKDTDHEPAPKSKLRRLPTKYEKETDERKLKSRQKQIDFGKNTVGYETYLKQIPKEKRTQEDPKSPDIHQICSKRSWDGQIKKWRKQLHKYDPAQEEDEIVIDFGSEGDVDVE